MQKVKHASAINDGRIILALIESDWATFCSYHLKPNDEIWCLAILYIWEIQWFESYLVLESLFRWKKDDY